MVVSGAVALFWWHGSKPAQPLTPVVKEISTGRSLRLGLNIASGSALHAAAVRFADLVDERSKGKLRVTVFPDQQLGTDDQMLEMTRNGELDLVLTPTAKLSSAIPAMQYADLPFYFSSREELYSMLDNEPGQMLLSKLSGIDLVGLTFWENGFKQFTANTPLCTPGDFAKLRIRTMKSRLIMDQFEALGAQAIPIDFHATYQALADGAVDGEENPLVAIVAMRFHEVQKHLTLSNHAYLGYVFSASKKVFETLSPQMRDIIKRSAQELTVWEREETARRETAFIETIRAAGVTISTLTPEERQCFHLVLAPLVDKFGFEIGYDLLTKTEELRYARQSATPDAGRGELVIGLDADLSRGGAQAGGAIFRGIQMAVEEINHGGGLLGSPLRLVAIDNGGNPSIGRQNLQRFAAIPGLLAVVGGMYTQVIMEELEEIHLLGIPYLIPWAAGHGLTAQTYQPSYSFRVSISDIQAAPFLLEHALKAGGHVAVLLEQTAWGRSNEAVLRPLIDKLPPGSAAIDWVNAGDPGIEKKLMALAHSGTQSLLMVTNPEISQSIVKAMARLDKPLPIFAHWGMTGGAFWAQEKEALKRVDLRFVQSVLPDDGGADAKIKEFARRYRTHYALGADTPIPSPVGTVHAYDLTRLLALAVMQAKSSDRVVIRDALETLPSYSGLMRDYNPPFTRDRHDALTDAPLYMARFDTRGRIVAVE
jgi:tripartite ATP-independent transporter DctP family solute receptor